MADNKFNIVDQKALAEVANQALAGLESARQSSEEFVTECMRRGYVGPEEMVEAIRIHLSKDGRNYPSLMDLHDGDIDAIAVKLRDLMLLAAQHGDDITVQQACTLGDIAAAESQYRLPDEYGRNAFIDMGAGKGRIIKP